MFDQLPKIERAKNEKLKNGYRYDIEVDGGINSDTIANVYSAGGEVMVAGNAVFGKGSIGENIRILKEYR
jgi:ribulose-phosphate 3-epimerase